MRLAAACALLLVPSAFAEGITIVLDFQGPKNEQSIAEMKREFAGIMKDASLTVDWKSRAEAEQLSFPNLLVVRFKGTCVLRPVPYLLDERGPLAFTYTTDGDVQPFSEVKCDEVSRVVRSAMAGADFANADLLMGRALGRVLAHEVVHILTKSGSHGHGGVAKSALSGRQLIGEELRLEPEDLDRIRADR
ncbi:MAG TPA: hypothetical protein VMJ75_18135 [Candidatus Acidoferrales bacterium]|nr:hypothetical protein [Candidatus Acidoferrales bacterium]